MINSSASYYAIHQDWFSSILTITVRDACLNWHGKEIDVKECETCSGSSVELDLYRKLDYEGFENCFVNRCWKFIKGAHVRARKRKCCAFYCTHRKLCKD